MTQPNIQPYSVCLRRRGFKSSLSHHWSDFFFKSDINFIRQFFYQTNFYPFSKRQFETSEAMRILNIRHVMKSNDTFHKEFVLSQTSIFITYSYYLKFGCSEGISEASLLSPQRWSVNRCV
jgi:hypothetical protein